VCRELLEEDASVETIICFRDGREVMSKPVCIFGRDVCSSFDLRRTVASAENNRMMILSQSLPIWLRSEMGRNSGDLALGMG